MKTILIGLMASILLMTTACAKSESEGEDQVAQEQKTATETAPVAAQERPTAAAPQRTGGRPGYWSSLGLDEGQVAEIREIRQRGGSVEEIRAVMTEEQALAWDERRAQRSDRSRPDDRERMRREAERNRTAGNVSSDYGDDGKATLAKRSYERMSTLTPAQKEELLRRSAEKITVINPGTSAADSDSAETATEESDDSGEG